MAQQTTLSPLATPGRTYSFLGKAVVVPDQPGLEFTLPENRPHWTLPTNRPHGTLPENRPHFVIPEEDR